MVTEVIASISHPGCGILLQEPGEGVCGGQTVLGGPTAGVLGRQMSDHSPQDGAHFVPTGYTSCTSGFWEKHIGPRARSCLEAARAFSLVSELGRSRTQMFYQACSVNMLLTHWPSRANHILSDFHCLLQMPSVPPS